jgi:predicted SprT family Zn-dependent metalloprotease
VSWLRVLVALFRVSTPGYRCWSGHTKYSMSRREYRAWRKTGRVWCGRCGGQMVRFEDDGEEEE